MGSLNERLRILYKQECEQAGIEPLNSLLGVLHDGTCIGGDSVDLTGSQKGLFLERVTAEHMMPLRRALTRDGSFDSLTVSWNPLGDKGARELATLVRESNHLEALACEGAEVGPAGVEAILESIAKAGTVRRLSMRCNPLGREGGMRVAEWLPKCGSLREIDIGMGDLDLQAAVAIFLALRDSGTAPEALAMDDVRHFSLQRELCIHAARAVSALGSSLTRLRLGKCGIQDDGLEVLVAYALAHKPNLQELHLHANKLTEGAGPHLNRLLTESPALSRLVLSSNRLADNGLKDIASALLSRSSAPLRELRVDCCASRDEGLQAIGRALQRNTALRELRVWGNRFGEASARILHDAVSSDPLLVLDVRPYNEPPSAASIDSQGDPKSFIAWRPLPTLPLS